MKKARLGPEISERICQPVSSVGKKTGIDVAENVDNFDLISLGKLTFSIQFIRNLSK